MQCQTIWGYQGFNIIYLGTLKLNRFKNYLKFKMSSGLIHNSKIFAAFLIQSTSSFARLIVPDHLLLRFVVLYFPLSCNGLVIICLLCILVLCVLCCVLSFVCSGVCFQLYSFSLPWHVRCAACMTAHPLWSSVHLTHALGVSLRHICSSCVLQTIIEILLLPFLHKLFHNEIKHFSYRGTVGNIYTLYPILSNLWRKTIKMQLKSIWTKPVSVRLRAHGMNLRLLHIYWWELALLLWFSPTTTILQPILKFNKRLRKLHIRQKIEWNVIDDDTNRILQI